jgi:hypothetical protein
MQFKYNYEKNALLLAERGVGFEEIIQAISDGNLLDIKLHYNQKKYPNQRILYVRLLAEVFAVPFVEEKNGDFFLKTLFPSRKARKAFLD